MSDPTIALTRQMLEWIASRPRTYAEVVEVWRTSCPRLSIWEDALADGLIIVERSPGMNGDRVVISALGLAVLDRM